MDLHPHPHIAARKVAGPPKHKQAAGTGFNSWLAPHCGLDSFPVAPPIPVAASTDPPTDFDG